MVEQFWNGSHTVSANINATVKKQSWGKLIKNFTELTRDIKPNTKKNEMKHSRIRNSNLPLY